MAREVPSSTPWVAQKASWKGWGGDWDGREEQWDRKVSLWLSDPGNIRVNIRVLGW